MSDEHHHHHDNLFNLIFLLPPFFDDLQESKSMFRGVHLPHANLHICMTRCDGDDDVEDYDNCNSKFKFDYLVCQHSYVDDTYMCKVDIKSRHLVRNRPEAFHLNDQSYI